MTATSSAWTTAAAPLARWMGDGWAAAAAVVTAAWVAVALAGGHQPPVADTVAGAAAAAGTAALVGAAWMPRTLASLAPAAAWLVVLPLAVAVADDRPALLAVAVVAAASGEVAAAARVGRARGPWLAFLVAGTAALVAAVVAGYDVVAALPGAGDALGGGLAGGEWRAVLGGEARGDDLAAVLGVSAGGLLLAGACLAPPRPRPLGVPALLVGVAAAVRLPAAPVTVVATTAAVLAAMVVPRRPGLALGLLAMAAASVPGGAPAALLLGAAACLSLAADHPAAALLGLPGGAALAAAVAEGVVTAAGVVTLAGAALIAALLAARAGPSERPALHRGALPALGLAAWLALRPGTWAWAGDNVVRPYDRGAAAALAGGVLAVVMVRATGLRGRVVTSDGDDVVGAGGDEGRSTDGMSATAAPASGPTET